MQTSKYIEQKQVQAMANIALKRIQQRVLDFSVILSYLNAHCKSSFQISGSIVFVILCFSSRLYNTNTHQYWYLHITQMRLLLILSSKSASSQFLRKTSKEGKLHQQKKFQGKLKYFLSIQILRDSEWNLQIMCYKHFVI